MDLLIEATVPGVPGLPLAASPGETVPQDAAFGELLQTLLSPGVPAPADPPPSDAIALLPADGDGDEGPLAEGGPLEDGLSDALAAALAVLSLGVVPPPISALASPDSPPAAEEASPDAIAPPTSSNAASAASIEASAGDAAIPGRASAPASETPAAEPGAPNAVVAGSPGVAPPALTEAPPTPQQSVVRLVGNATPVLGDDSDAGARTTDKSQPALTPAIPATPLQPQSPASATVVVDAPGAPAPSAPFPPVARVAQAVIERIEDGGGDVRLRLDPPDLGEIVIHVTVDGGDVRVDVQADNADAARLLRDATPNLSTLLGERGLGLADVSVGHGGRDSNQQAFGQDSFGRQGRHDDGAFAALMGIDSSVDTRQFNRVRATYNPDGAFIYRI